MKLSELSRRVIALRDLPPSARRRRVVTLLPHLRDVAADPAVGVETRVRLLVQAARAVDPRAGAAGDPEGALAVLEEKVGAPRGAGRPAVGHPTTVRLPADVYDWLDAEATRRGLPTRAAVIRAVLDEARLEVTGSPER